MAVRGLPPPFKFHKSLPPPSISVPSPIPPSFSMKPDISISLPSPPLLSAECRICQEEEDIENLDKPCACSGSIQYAHRVCVQRWCDEKGDTVCEICRQPYKSGYTAPPCQANDVSIDLSDDWDMGLRDAQLLAIQRRFLDAQYEEANSSSVACCRSVALTLMALLLVRHAISVAFASASKQEDASMFFTLFLLRAVGFVLPCYIMVRALSMLQRSRHRQEEAMVAAAEVAIILQAGQPHRYFSLTHPHRGTFVS